MSVNYIWAGAGTPTSIWVRGSVNGASVRLAVADNDAMNGPQYYGPVTPTGQGIASVEADGLEPNTRYWYAFEVDGTIDTDFTGTFLTHPPLDGTPQSFVFGAAGDAGLPGTGDDSHISNFVSNNPVFDVMTRRALHEDWVQFCHLGDLHYRDIATNSLAAYRQAYHDTLTFNGTLGANARQGVMLRSVPVSYVWDDHLARLRS